MIDIAQRPPTQRTIVSEIARRQDIPVFYLAKIMPRLAQAGLVRTSLGAAGGIDLAAPPEEISLLQIVQAVDGSPTLNLCSTTPSECILFATCAACAIWRKAQTQLDQLLSETRLSDLAAAPAAASTRAQCVRKNRNHTSRIDRE